MIVIYHIDVLIFYMLPIVASNFKKLIMANINATNADNDANMISP